MTALHTNTSYYILRRKDVSERLQLSRSTIYDRMNPKSPRYDPHFPKPLRLGPKAVGWLESELNAYVQQLARTG